MLFLRWLYKIWSFLLYSAGVIIVAALIILTLVVGVLQLPVSKKKISIELTELFNNNFEGTLTIESITGFLPFYATLHQPRFSAPDDTTGTVLTLDKISININAWDLLTRQLSISGFDLSEPDLKVIRNPETGRFTISELFDSQNMADPPEESGELPPWLQSYAIFAPSITISDGVIEVADLPDSFENLNLTPPFTADNINSSFFLEFNDEQRFLEINQFRASLAGTPIQNLLLSGQVFSDDQFFELNRFTISTAQFTSTFDFDISPVNILSDSLNEKLKEANYRFDMSEFSADPQKIRELIPGFPGFSNSIYLESVVEGTIDTMYVDRLLMVSGESSVQMTGILQKLNSPDFRYLAQIENLVVGKKELDLISENLKHDFDTETYHQSILRGSVVGSLNHIRPELTLETNNGSLEMISRFEFKESGAYDLQLMADSLNLGPLFPDLISESALNWNINAEGTGYDLSDAEFSASIGIDSSFVNHITVSEGNLQLLYSEGKLTHNLSLSENNSELNVSGSYSKQNDIHDVVIDAGVKNINLQQLLQKPEFAVTDFSMEFSTDFNASSLNDLYGRISFEVSRAVIDGDTLQPHQLFADIDEPFNSTRSLRLTSSFFDGQINGNIEPRLIQNMARHWYNYINSRLRSEILLETEVDSIAYQSPFLNSEAPKLDLTLSGEVKNIDLLKKYIQSFPDLKSSARINANVNATPERLLLTATTSDPLFSFNTISADTVQANFTSSFRYSEPLREYSTIDLQVNSSKLTVNGITSAEAFLNLSMREDSLMITQSANRIAEDLNLESTLLLSLQTDRVEMVLDNFSMGSETYNWTTDGKPAITFLERDAIQFDNLRFRSGAEILEIDGILSEDPGDSLSYNIQNLNLGRISELIGGRVTFSGNMNGNFNTQSLTTKPAIQGTLGINQAMLNNRTVGDVNLRSRLNPELEQFDTNISIFTNPKKYERYYTENDSIGQDIRLNGYLKIPDEQDSVQDLFAFDVDLNEIDMWILSVIIPNIIEEMEGSATGKGTVSGNLDTIAFNLDADVRNVYAKPVFVNTEYTLDGDLNFNSTDGLILNELRLTDSNGGTGFVNGIVDVNNFQPTTYLDLSLEMQDLHFMNNPFDPDIPFFASLYGSGELRLSGTNFSPLLRTITPIRISPNSRFSIPLEEETEVEENRRFIQFVDSFDLSTIWRSDTAQDENGNGVDDDAEDLADLTFLERFTLDLQFSAENQVNFQLIFDRVTNEVLNANGTGQIRLLLEDQTVSMFGRFNIEGGDYQFVSGDIFTRRFALEQGGTILWEGEPTDARLNLNAIFRARPDISTLLATSGGGAAESGTGQRVPVELVLGIRGTVSQVENEFFFRVPTGIEGSLDPTLSTQINNLNQNEDDKLIQATSILLTGNFIPLAQSQADGSRGFGDQLTGTAMVVNPLLSSQVINPLLSNQINSLLSSDVTFDVDVNLNSFNEVD
ncbi:MAG TPA: hypothetical protein VKM36_12030, partial [Balneolaceae bacterium]|nr:hypothetical protein [Balneolaceae bacterium]